jgi:hypothetical protein
LFLVALLISLFLLCCGAIWQDLIIKRLGLHNTSFFIWQRMQSSRLCGMWLLTFHPAAFTGSKFLIFFFISLPCFKASFRGCLLRVGLCCLIWLTYWLGLGPVSWM